MKKLTAELLRKLVKEEHSKLVDANGKKVPEPEEYKAGEEADTLEQPINIAKALKVEESKILEQRAKLDKKLRLVRERRRQVIKKLLGEK